MPMELCSSSYVYQKSIEQLLKALSWHVIMDDILITGTDDKDHLETLDKVFTRLNSAGLTFKL